MQNISIPTEKVEIVWPEALEEREYEMNVSMNGIKNTEWNVPFLDERCSLTTS